MDANTIIQEFTTARGMPYGAIFAAVERRGEMAPIFIDHIRRYVAGGATDEEAGKAVFLMFHLLGEWREKVAYPVLASLLHLPPDAIHEAIGDATTETSHRVIAAVFNGDPQPIYDIILDPNACEFSRSRMCEALAMLVRDGKLARSEVATFLHDCFTKLEPKATNFVWQGWQSAIALLGLEELSDLVKKAFELDYICMGWLDFEDFEEDLTKTLTSPMEAAKNREHEFSLFDNTIQEFSNWASFKEGEGEEEDFDTDDLDDIDETKLAADLLTFIKSPNVQSFQSAGDPIQNPYKDVGRNNPCPCGSGKKFKKCCLN